MDRAQIIRHKLLRAKLDKHRDVLDKHKERGPAFQEAAERLERALSCGETWCCCGTCPRTGSETYVKPTT